MPRLTFHLIAHTHWDREWYLPAAGFRARLVPLVDDLLTRLAGDGAGWSFLLDGQTVLTEDYLSVRPDRAPALERAVRSGRLQLGPWYVLADEQIPAAESLIRNLLLGRADAVRLGGRLDVCYSPDAFGHPAILPALAREFSLPYAVLWRGVGSEAPGRDLFRWVGPDGRAVLVYHLPPAGYEVGGALAADPRRLPALWTKVRSQLVSRAATSQVAVFVGADHHAVHPDLPRLRAMLTELEPKSEFRLSRLDEYFRAAEAAAAELSVVEGELRSSYGYTWTLQGVHSTRAPLKRRSSGLELGLTRMVEPLAALSAWAGRGDVRPLLDATWRSLLQCHFHDTLAGTTSDAVAAEMAARLHSVGAASEELARERAHALLGHDPDKSREATLRRQPLLALWNPAARPRSGVLVAEVSCFRQDIPIGPPGRRKPRQAKGYRPFGLSRPGESPVEMQVISVERALERLDAARHYPDLDEVDRVRVALAAPSVQGLGFESLVMGPAARRSRRVGVLARGRRLANALVEVSVERGGGLTIVDRRSGKRYTRQLTLESGGDVGDCYSYCPPERDRISRFRGLAGCRVVSSGPLYGALEATYRMRVGNGKGDVEVRLGLELVADSPLVRVSLSLENRARGHRLRARFPLGLPGKALAGAQFGATCRSAVAHKRGRSRMETPVLTAPAQRYVAAGAGRRGLALFAPGFFEYEWTPTGDLLFTLLRSVGQLSRNDLSTRPGHAAWPTPTPDAECLGPTTIELALGPLDAAPAAPVLERLWEDAFVPMRGFWLRDWIGGTVADVSLNLEGEGLVLSAVKPAESGDGIVVRCFNCRDQSVNGVVRLARPVREAQRLRADERDAKPLSLADEGRSVHFTAEARAIVTLLFR